jgi:sugar lactone lactonase YvrE
MRHPLRRTAAALLLLTSLLLALATPVAADARDLGGRDLPATFTLFGDPGGSQFEGLDVAKDRRTLYVTETTGGEIHRGRVDDSRTDVWLDEDEALADGRRTAVGIAADRNGWVYVAGGDNRTEEGAPADAPDFWVYDGDRNLLAALRMPVEGRVFLNDVVVGPDGAAYVTDSVTPRIFRVALEDGNWRATVWADAAGTINQTGPFGLNGIEVAPDDLALLVAQSDVGALWNFDLGTAAPTRIDTGTITLTQADGLVVKGRTLVVVRNRAHVLTYVRLLHLATATRLLGEVATDPDRVFTTADVADRRLLLVDSQFDEDPPSRNSEVVVLPIRG